MKIIEGIEIKKNEEGYIELSILDCEDNECRTLLTKQEALCVAYYILGLTDSMDENK